MLIALKIVVDAVKKSELERRILRYGSTGLSGIHVSQLVYCLRKSYFRRAKPKRDTMERMYHLLRGKSHHQFLEVLPLREVRVSRDPIATVDMTEDGVIYEIKSTLSGVYGPRSQWIEQLMYYVILSGSSRREHYLVVFHVAKPDLTVYKISVTDDDIEKYAKRLWNKYRLLKKAIELNRPNILPRATFEWYCEKCEYKEECEAIDQEPVSTPRGM